MAGIISAVIYVVILVCILYVISYRRTVQFKGIKLSRGSVIACISVGQMALFSMLFVLLNIYITNNSVGYGHDRSIYLLDFNGRSVIWSGFDFLISTVRSFTSNYKVFLYLTTFLCCFICFLAYSISTDASPNTLLFVLSSYFVVSTLSHLKQCYATAFAMLFFSIIFRPKTIWRDSLCAGIAVLASMFHATGFILFPILIYFWLNEKRPKYTLLYVLVLIFLLFNLEDYVLQVARSTEGFIPQLSNKIYEYFGDESAHADSGSIVFLKSFPYYVLFIWGCIKRKQLFQVTPNYDKYFILTAIGATLSLASYQSYWLNRFPIVLVFPMGVFYSILMKNTSKKENRLIMSVLVVGSSLFFTLRSIVLSFINLGGF